MAEQNNGIRAVLSLLREPAVFVQDGQVGWSNPAAAKLALRPGDALSALLGDAEKEYRAWSGEGMLHLPVRAMGMEWECSAIPTEEGTLLLLQRSADEDEAAALMAAAARSVHPAFVTLKTAGEKLIPYLEEMEDPVLQEYTAPIIRAGHQLMRSLTQFGGFCRYAEDRPALRRDRVEIAPYFEDLLEKAADILYDCGVTLESKVSLPEHVFGCLDEKETERAVMNLLSNAVHFGGRDEPVRVRVTREEQILRICVVSVGEPMDPQVLATAFSRYRQPTSAIAPGSGAGLGLAAVRTIARQQGGSVMLSSVGRETTAVMTLSLRTPRGDELRSPSVDMTCGYDPSLVELSGELPDDTFDSRNVDI